MSAELYYTTIKPSDLPPKDGVPLYDMSTQSYPETVSKTEEELRTELIREGRIYQPIKWAARIGFTGGIIYSLSGVAGYALPGFTFQAEGAQTNQIVAGMFFWVASNFTSEILGNTLSKWESKKHAFDKTFSPNVIHLIPERFNPANLSKRINPLKLIHR